MRRYPTAAAAAVIASLVAPSARAQMPNVIPPKATIDGGVAYPDQAIRDGVSMPATVMLRLTIDANGLVTDAQVETPAGHGFDEAALAAARTLRFAPATRDGIPVASRIRYRYVFTPPAAAPPSPGPALAPPTPSPGPATAPASIPDSPEEVVVQGRPLDVDVARHSLTADEAQHLPGARGDALASIEAMPGVGHSAAPERRAHLAGIRTERHQRVRGRHGHQPAVPLRSLQRGLPDRGARTARLLSGQLRGPVRARDGRRRGVRHTRAARRRTLSRHRAGRPHRGESAGRGPPRRRLAVPRRRAALDRRPLARSAARGRRYADVRAEVLRRAARGGEGPRFAALAAVLALRVRRPARLLPGPQRVQRAARGLGQRAHRVRRAAGAVRRSLRPLGRAAADGVGPGATSRAAPRVSSSTTSSRPRSTLVPMSRSG